MKSVLKPILVGLLFLSLWGCSGPPSGAPQPQIPGPHEEQQMELGKVDVPQEKIAAYPGLDILKKMGFDPLIGKSVGVVTNHTAVDRQGVHLVDLLHSNTEITVKAIFAPEHGFRGTEQGGDDIPGGIDSATGIPIYSLYGAQQEPNPEMLKGIDVLLFDIQDVGTRFYTYISTMGYVLEAGAKNNIPVMILDRPNPIGRRIDGNVLDEGFASFVGRYKIPIQYGLSIGELARMIIGEKMIPGLENLELHVVECGAWTGELFWSETDLHWIPPSPNMRNTNETLTYPGLCLLEGVRINEGRGTEYPFEYIGAPYMDGKLMARELLSTALKGFTLEPISYTPLDMPGVAMNPLFEGEVVHGVKIVVTDPYQFKAIDFLVHLLVITKQQYPDDFGWRSARGPDRLWGGTGLREMVDEGKTAAEIIDSYQSELRAFESIQSKYWIYGK
ncbi:MAG: DUF1343 domain-containing protein [Candidatus Marinimicrobia bacterium]|nr:DUF1343 domain-containing protein [Candidatus Neomarinimicrobiota bacterium]